MYRRRGLVCVVPRPTNHMRLSIVTLSKYLPQERSSIFLLQEDVKTFPTFHLISSYFPQSFFRFFSTVSIPPPRMPPIIHYHILRIPATTNKPHSPHTTAFPKQDDHHQQRFLPDHNHRRPRPNLSFHQQRWRRQLSNLGSCGSPLR